MKKEWVQSTPAVKSFVIDMHDNYFGAWILELQTHISQDAQGVRGSGLTQRNSVQNGGRDPISCVFDLNLVVEKLTVLRMLLILAAMRLSQAFFSALHLAPAAAAWLIDALTQRKLALISFSAPKPVISSAALSIATTCFMVALLCAFAPFAAFRQTAALLLLTAFAALTVWLRHFHRFGR